MIALENLTKTYRVEGVSHNILTDANFTFRSGRSIALLGRNGAGKSSLLKLISGAMKPTSGRVKKQGTVSWPVGFSGSFNADLTGAQNIKFVARIYGVDTEYLVDFVDSFADLGKHFHLPFRTYSSGMRSRLAFGLSMGVRFDTYLIDEVTSVGDLAFKTKSENFLNARLADSGAIVVSHSMDLLKRICDSAVVMENGRLAAFDSIDEAIAQHQQNMRTG